jgi:hypothetical protein
MTTERENVIVANVPSEATQKQLKTSIGDALSQNVLFQVMSKAWTRRHGSFSISISFCLCKKL